MMFVWLFRLVNGLIFRDEIAFDYNVQNFAKHVWNLFVCGSMQSPEVFPIFLDIFDFFVCDATTF